MISFLPSSSLSLTVPERTWAATRNSHHLPSMEFYTYLPKISICFSTESFHLVRGLPIGLFLCMVSISTFLMISLSALHTYSNHSVLLIFVNDKVLGFPHSLYRSPFFLLSNVPVCSEWFCIAPFFRISPVGCYSLISI